MNKVDFHGKIMLYYKRSGSIPWLDDDLEGFKDEAILEVDSQTDILSEIKKIQCISV